MISRRDWLGTSLGAGAALALTPALLRALQQSQGKLIQRAIPSSGEMLPVIGLSRGNVPADPAALKEVYKTLVDNGGRVLDAVHGGASAEALAGTIATELGIQKQIFWSTKVSVPPRPLGTAAPKTDPAEARAHIEAVFARFKVPTIDLLQVRPFDDVPGYLAVLREMKKEGRVRYIGVTAAFDNQYPQLEAIMRNEPIDFIGIDYAIDNRNVEETILPLARERKIGVLAYFPFGGNVGPDRTTVVSTLFPRVGTTPLPAWAAEFDAKSWGQFFLKYVISHPAVTVARVGTDKATHMLDNIGGGIGRLPDEATRKRMAAFIDALPALPPRPQNPARAPGIALPLAILDRYVGEWKLPSGTVVGFRRSGARLLVKAGNDPEAPLTARSETRLQDPRGPVFEFQVDGQGKVTGLILEQGTPSQRTPLQRK
jgi:aryl-alcohol dehydrogenase-like predicted oxidoreductase